MSRVVFDRPEQPAVSIVMVTYGGWAMARRSLEAVRDRTPLPYEVILVDNASPDGTGERLRWEVDGATVVLNERNFGFGPAVNQAADLARARYLALLNSDALVQPGWLEPLIAVLERDPTVGAAVSRLLNEDGTVQEAGSILWSDGSTLALGSGADATDPAYRFRRDTDYGSAACMLIRRSAFVAVGGFDPAYRPAYVEDVDLALSLRHRGLRTVYEPRSSVVHVRFGSSDQARAARLIEANREILRRRWARELDARVPPLDSDHPHRLVAARDALAPDRILVVGDEAPPELLGALAARFPRGRVTFLTVGAAPEEPAAAELLGAGVELAGPVDDPRTWFDARLFHASAVVVLGARSFAEVGGHLHGTQPQALVIHDLGTPPRSASEPRRSDVDAGRAADVVLCRDETQARLAGELAPGRRVRITSDVDLPTVVVDELAVAGIVAHDVATA